MVPGVKPAASQSRRGRVTILATPGTLDGALYARVVEEFGQTSQIVAVPGAGLAELVEEGGIGTPRSRDAVKRVLEPEIDAGSDTVVLGCTHYCFLAADIKAAFPSISIVDTSDAVARRALQVLQERDGCTSSSGPGVLDLIVNGDREAFEGVARRLGIAV
jgi:glutamate racemase